MIAVCLVWACEQRKPQLSEKDIEAIRAGAPGIFEDCLDKVRYGGLVDLPPVDQCFEMTPRQRWTGLWGTDFELSRFCADPAKACGYGEGGDRIWLSMADPALKSARIPEAPLYKIDFEGRRTVKPGVFGHLGRFQYEIFVDKVNSIVPVAVDQAK